MEKELKDALIAIANYDGKPVQKYKGKLLIGEEYSVNIGGTEYGKYVQWDDCKYHTSADALLPVWDKVIKDERQKLNMKTITAFSLLITSLNYPAACIKLAEIIKQLKNG
jgi:hypothetical protein